MGKIVEGLVTFSDGEIVLLNEVSKVYPFTMLESAKETIIVAQFVAEHIYSLQKDTLNFKVAVNYLKQRSPQVKCLAALLIVSRVRPIGKVDSSFDNRFRVLFGSAVNFIHSGERLSFLSDVPKTTFLVKFLVNWSYRYIGAIKARKRSGAANVVRVWVELDEQLHSSHINQSKIFIYPFGLKVTRGIRFIVKAYRKYQDVRLHGVPYRLSNLLMILFTSDYIRDIKIIEFEIEGYKRHIKDFKGFRQIFTSDEYLPAVNVMYEALIKSEDCRVVNVNHGVGLYNPYVAYSSMDVFNSRQSEYYKILNKDIIFDERYRDCSHKLSSKYKEIVFIDQGNLDNYGLIYEEKLQNNVMNILGDLATDNDVKVTVKFHPNRSEQSRDKLKTKYDTISFSNNLDVLSLETLFICLFSTAYYDYCEKADFIFVSSQDFDPKRVFSDSIIVVKISQLQLFLASRL